MSNFFYFLHYKHSNIKSCKLQGHGLYYRREPSVLVAEISNIAIFFNLLISFSLTSAANINRALRCHFYRSYLKAVEGY